MRRWPRGKSGPALASLQRLRKTADEHHQAFDRVRATLQRSSPVARFGSSPNTTSTCCSLTSSCRAWTAWRWPSEQSSCALASRCYSPRASPGSPPSGKRPGTASCSSSRCAKPSCCGRSKRRSLHGARREPRGHFGLVLCRTSGRDCSFVQLHRRIEAAAVALAVPVPACARRPARACIENRLWRH